MLKVAKHTELNGRTKAITQIQTLLVPAPQFLREKLNGLSSGELISTYEAFLAGTLEGPSQRTNELCAALLGVYKP